MDDYQDIAQKWGECKETLLSYRRFSEKESIRRALVELFGYWENHTRRMDLDSYNRLRNAIPGDPDYPERIERAIEVALDGIFLRFFVIGGGASTDPNIDTRLLNAFKKAFGRPAPQNKPETTITVTASAYTSPPQRPVTQRPVTHPLPKPTEGSESSPYRHPKVFGVPFGVLVFIIVMLLWGAVSLYSRIRRNDIKQSSLGEKPESVSQVESPSSPVDEESETDEDESESEDGDHPAPVRRPSDDVDRAKNSTEPKQIHREPAETEIEISPEVSLVLHKRFKWLLLRAPLRIETGAFIASANAAKAMKEKALEVTVSRQKSRYGKMETTFNSWKLPPYGITLPNGFFVPVTTSSGENAITCPWLTVGVERHLGKFAIKAENDQRALIERQVFGDGASEREIRERLADLEYGSQVLEISRFKVSGRFLEYTEMHQIVDKSPLQIKFNVIGTLSVEVLLEDTVLNTKNTFHLDLDAYVQGTLPFKNNKLSTRDARVNRQAIFNAISRQLAERIARQCQKQMRLTRQ